MKHKVVIVQPYVPAYRLSFFENLIRQLAENEIDCRVAAGQPTGEQYHRGDAVSPDWLEPINYKTIEIAGLSALLSVNPKPWIGARAVVMSLGGSSLPVYRAMIASKLSGTKVALWGHIKPYVSLGNPLDLRLERWQMMHADHIFAYTPGGARYAEFQGVPPGRITTVMNTVDTKTLSVALGQISQDDVNQFASDKFFHPDRAVAFIGGLDDSKRIAFLAETLDQLWERDRSIKILIGGKGPDQTLLCRAQARGQAILMGYVDNSMKALILASSKAICMPGRIGLIAVDALVARRPVIATTWPFHAPELEYLIQGESVYMTPDHPWHYAQEIQRVVDISHFDGEFHYPTIEQMTSNFTQGISKLVNSTSGDG